MAQQEKQAGEKKDYIGAARNFLGEVSLEAKKVVWPTRETLIQSSMTVFGVLIILTTIMGVFDFIWGTIFNLIT